MAYIVCPDCCGEGSHAPGFIYTVEDVERDFASIEDFQEHLNDIRSGQYDRTCTFCRGRRVVDSEQAEHWEEEQEYRAEREAEIRAGC